MTLLFKVTAAAAQTQLHASHSCADKPLMQTLQRPTQPMHALGATHHAPPPLLQQQCRQCSLLDSRNSRLLAAHDAQNCANRQPTLATQHCSRIATCTAHHSSPRTPNPCVAAQGLVKGPLVLAAHLLLLLWCEVVLQHSKHDRGRESQQTNQ